MTDIIVHKKNEVFIQLECNEGIAKELYEDFTFQAKNYQYGKRKGWDGRIHLFHLRDYSIYAGLTRQICRWAREKQYTISGEKKPSIPLVGKALETFYDGLRLPFQPREDQTDIFQKCVIEECGTIISPTGSGKSLIAYLLTQWYNVKTLIIVPTINLVEQMSGDFADYGFNVGSYCHKVYEGADPISDKQVTITTWQALIDLPNEYFNHFQMVIGDEAQGFKAKSLRAIMERMVHTPYRFAMTATLANENELVNELIIEGLFGPQIIGSTTQDLIKEGHLAELEINIIVLKYPEAFCRTMRRKSINEETDFLVSYEPRQSYIRNLACSLKGSTFVLYRLVEKHGKGLFDIIHKVKGDNTHIVYGETDAENRELIRLTANENVNTTVVASYGVFSGGVNVPNLRNGVFASSYKSKIKVLQSIGRTLRKTPTKPKATIYDIVDDLSIGTHINYSVKHYLERLKLYYKEFPDMNIKIYTVPLEVPKQEGKTPKNAKNKKLCKQ